jgi:hypothetical protein
MDADMEKRRAVVMAAVGHEVELWERAKPLFTAVNEALLGIDRRGGRAADYTLRLCPRDEALDCLRDINDDATPMRFLGFEIVLDPKLAPGDWRLEPR